MIHTQTNAFDIATAHLFVGIFDLLIEKGICSREEVRRLVLHCSTRAMTGSDAEMQEIAKVMNALADVYDPAAR